MLDHPVQQLLILQYLEVQQDPQDPLARQDPPAQMAHPAGPAGPTGPTGPTGPAGPSATNASTLGGKSLANTGDHFNVIMHTSVAGVMECGRFIDFHLSDGDTADFSGGRITSNSTSIDFSKACIAPSFTGTSDRNLKNSIVDSDLGLDFINKLKPVSFKWNQDQEEELQLDTKTHYGLVAQDVEDVITGLGKTLDDICIAVKSEDTFKNGHTVPMSVDYLQLTSVLIKAVQELSAKIDVLEAK